ncbi:hypothetical protein C8R44DRAFT_863034 [Mycena epipterygia]|nr:hypothetical protein C8R44DRAFT_863034 [Mycena epipterygia]
MRGCARIGTAYLRRDAADAPRVKDTCGVRGGPVRMMSRRIERDLLVRVVSTVQCLSTSRVRARMVRRGYTRRWTPCMDAMRGPRATRVDGGAAFRGHRTSREGESAAAARSELARDQPSCAGTRATYAQRCGSYPRRSADRCNAGAGGGAVSIIVWRWGEGAGLGDLYYASRSPDERGWPVQRRCGFERSAFEGRGRAGAVRFEDGLWTCMRAGRGTAHPCVAVRGVYAGVARVKRGGCLRRRQWCAHACPRRHVDDERVGDGRRPLRYKRKRAAEVRATRGVVGELCGEFYGGQSYGAAVRRGMRE